MCLAQGPQRSEADEAQTRGLSVSSQALYHWATALPASYMSAHVLLQLSNTLRKRDKMQGYVEHFITFS